MELFCVICRLADGAQSRPAETIYNGMALCGVHFEEIADYQDLDAAERDAVTNSRRVDAMRAYVDQRRACWMKTAPFTEESYCGEHGRAAGWPCREAR